MNAVPLTPASKDAPSIEALAAELAAAREQIARLEADRQRLREALERLWLEIALLKRRIFVAKAERVDTTQLELEFKDKLAQLDALAGTSEMPPPESEDDDGKRARAKPKGRRRVEDMPLPEERIEISDPEFEALVEQGQAERIGFEESYKLAWQRSGARRLVVARVKYRTVDPDGESALETAPVPPQLFPRSLAAVSMLAHVLVSKFNDGLPFHRMEEILGRSGVTLDRGTMCRWAEDAGATLGATIVEAMRRDALSNAFCIACDGTGIAVQPVRRADKKRQACRRGHYFAMIADASHIWFEYSARDTSDNVKAMFKDFAGYVQVDAKSTFDVLFRDGPPGKPEPDDPRDDVDRPPVRLEVACWAHARRKYWEAALARSVTAREALARIARIFELDALWKGKPPAMISQQRNAHLRPHVAAFLSWAEAEYDKVKGQRGPLRSALGYTVRQKDALARFLDDGRLKLDNNRSELALRGRVAVGRKAWLFVGSDDHAQSATGIMSLIASARLHRLDPETYLRDVLRVLPHWPRDRYLELSPLHWAATRARLDGDDLARELGALTVPLPPPPQEQPQPN